MKIIKEGSELWDYQQHGWWVGLRLGCAKCGCEFELEWKDRADIIQTWHSVQIRDGFQCVVARCPQCASKADTLVEHTEYYSRQKVCLAAQSCPEKKE